MKPCSIIIPAHNEAEYLEEFVAQFLDTMLNAKSLIKEIHIVENGSADNTYQVAIEIKKRAEYPVFAHSLPTASYGEAIRHGIKSANAQWICILECDLLDADFVINAAEIISDDAADFVIASKRHPCSIDTRPWHRRLLTLLYNIYLKKFFCFKGTDTHGLKAIKSSAAKRIIDECIASDEALQTEIVLLAPILGYKLVEIPIRVKEQRNSPAPIFRRASKIIRAHKELRKSLSRYSNQ